MLICGIDVETYWSDTHTLKKMNAIEYAMHPDTELISLGLKLGGNKTEVVFGESDIRHLLSEVDFSDSLLVAHNMSGFDAFILAWRLGVKPKGWACTLAMARPVHAKTLGLSLGALVDFYGIGTKDNSALVATKGKRLVDFTLGERRAMETYNAADVDQCVELFHTLKPHYTNRELWQLDCTIRMAIEPKIALNRQVLTTALRDVKLAKTKALINLGARLKNDPKCSAELRNAPIAELESVVKRELASTPKFAKLLESLGIDVPMKQSPTNPDKWIPALSKTDKSFIDLQDHESPVVSEAARVRLGVKSTLLETRLQAFLAVGRVTRGLLPGLLHYCGADTTGRWSGWLYNLQNLNRVNPKKPALSDALRRSMHAPKGHKLVVGDLSGIELRVNHFLWKVPSSMAAFRASPGAADLYIEFAAEFYGLDQSAVDALQRQVGKVAHLGLGFGAGGDTFQTVARVMGGVQLTLEESRNVTYAWRAKYPEIPAGWRRCHTMLDYILAGTRVAIDPWGLTHTCSEGIELPSGRIIRYPHLRKEYDENGKMEWAYGLGRHKTRIYAGKIDENIVQALARDIITAIAFAVFLETGYRPSLSVHDELVYVVPDHDVARVEECMHRHMRTPPSWWPELITWSAGAVVDSYADAK